MCSFPDIELIFVSGVLESDVWKHQKRYFSGCCEVKVLDSSKSNDIESRLEEILANSENAVVVGCEFGNLAVQRVEDHDNVMTTVLTGPFRKLSRKNQRIFNVFLKLFSHPKFTKIALFSNETNYSVVKDFVSYIPSQSPDKILNLMDYDLRVPVKNSLIIYNNNCRFSNKSSIEDLTTNSELACIDAGSFSFFEKPQEFNKALNDYLLNKTDFLEKRNVVRSASENRSLKDFEQKKLL